jgi:transcription-repair coupling factor (superfamily II helicase)
VRKRSLAVAPGDRIDVGRLVSALVAEGYARADLVTECGDLAVRGGLVDVFPPNLAEPVRIELGFEEVESVRTFDPDTQRSTGKLSRVLLPPMTATADTPRSREQALAVLAACRTEDDEPPVPRDPDAPRKNDGLEELLPLLAGDEPPASILDHAPAFALAVDDPDAVTEELGRGRRPPPPRLREGAPAGQVAPRPVPPRGRPGPHGRPRSRPCARVVRGGGLRGRDVRPRGRAGPLVRGPPPGRAARDREGAARRPLRRPLVPTKGEREHLGRILSEYEIDFAGLEGDATAPLAPGACRLADGGPASGFLFRPGGLLLLTAADVLGEPRAAAPRRRAASEAFLSDLRDLKPGDVVVHRDYGIALFRGLVTIQDAGVAREMVDLRYAGDAKLLVPVERLDLLQKYQSGGEGPLPPLDKLGGTGWAKRKASVRKAVKDIAEQLLKLYARRATTPGHAFSKDSPWQKEFEEAFEFTETPDQLGAIRDIKRDMESDKAMDRLLCGDVGYGKTEVAMRAVFKCVLDGKQAAILAPTTILADQHHRTLRRRFAAFPVTIDLLSRFRSPEEQKEVARRLAEGTLDVVVGTHRILSKDVSWKDLGLVVIDEEQRFGVAQKEKLKELRASVEVLSMSATPIPRSLNLALGGNPGPLRHRDAAEGPPGHRDPRRPAGGRGRARRDPRRAGPGRAGLPRPQPD